MASIRDVAFGHDGYLRPPPCPVVPVCPTILQAGDGSGDLQVHVTGSIFSRLEIYFRESVATETIQGAANLHCYQQILLAPDSNFGTFGIRYGPHGDTFRLFGWKSQGTVLVSTPPLTPYPGCPVRLTWVTTRIAKINYGATLEGTMILRFDDADKPWVRFDEATQKWIPL